MVGVCSFQLDHILRLALGSRTSRCVVSPHFTKFVRMRALPAWLLYWSIIVGGHARAQELSFQHLTTTDGLSDNSITCIFEDREGYIWIGTESGLDRFDGQRVHRFTDPKVGPGGSNITSIAQDEQGRIWVASSDGGLSLFDAHAQRFIRYRNDPKDPKTIPSDRLNHITPLDNGSLLICSQDHGLIWAEPERAAYRHGSSARLTMPVGGDTALAFSHWCHTALPLGDGRIWMGMVSTGTSFILDPNSGNVLNVLRSMYADSLHMLTNACVVGNELFAGGWGPGLSRFTIDRWDQQTYMPFDDEITAIVPWRNGSVLLGTKSNGIIELDGKSNTVQRHRHRRHVPSSLTNDLVRCMLVDRSGDLWVGTANGLAYYSPAVWRMSATDLFEVREQDQQDLTFHGLQQDPDGRIRISTSHGFFLVQTHSQQVERIPVRDIHRPLEVTGLFDPLPGTWLIGTETGYLYYDPIKEEVIPGTPRTIHSNRTFQVRSIHAEQFPEGPQLLIGALGWSHFKLDPKGLQVDTTWKAFADRVEHAGLIRCTVKDRHGRYWSGTSKGLVSWSAQEQDPSKSVVTYGLASTGIHHFPGDDVRALYVQGDTIWAALRDAGLVAVAGDRVLHFEAPAHIPSDLLGLTVDHAGNVWCTSGHGLVRFAPKGGSWVRIPVNDGSTYQQLNKCVLTLSDGMIAFCADNTLITFDPRSFDVLGDLPTPYLVDVHNSNGILTPSASGNIDILYRSSSFDATISALGLKGAGPLVFVYRLEGVEAAPQVVTANEPLRYAGVPVGDHALFVKVRDAYGREGPEHKLLTVRIQAPFWQRWWFYALLTALGSATMWMIARYRKTQTDRLQHMRDTIARDLHDDVGSTLGSINFYSEALKRKLVEAGDPMAKDVAERIGQSSREMIDRMADIVWSVDPQNDDGASLLERMQAFATDLLATRGIAVDWDVSTNMVTKKMNTDLRRNLFLIFKEAIHNAAKYAECSRLFVRFHVQGDHILLEVRDNGVGFDPQNVDSYNGNGLVSMNKRAALLGGHVSLESTMGEGTKVYVVVPIR